MDFDESVIVSKPLQIFLQHQVEEQSEVCDVTVRIDQWERKYHRCVLMTSPFFECALRNDFMEKYTGKINLKCGTPTSIDMALMYLYGMEPVLDCTNIEVMIQLAEFFQITNLKSVCVNWLENQTISGENCLSWMLMSSMYQLELRECTEYLESHLNDVLLQTTSVNLTFEYIHYIFTEKKLSYFQMEDRLRFLMRWYVAKSDKRYELTKKLLESINFEDVSITCLNVMKRDKRVENILQEVDTGLLNPNRFTDVLICKPYESFLCFDLARATWFKLHVDATSVDLGYVRVLDTNINASEFYMLQFEFARIQLFTFNWVTSEKKMIDVVTNTGATVKINRNKFDFRNNLCVTCKSEKVITKDTSVDITNNDLPTYRNTVWAHIGNITDKQVKLSPLLSFAGSKISTVTVNDDAAVAFVPNSRACLFIYDTIGCTLDKLDINTQYEDKIVPAKNGFVVHSNERCITIMKSDVRTLKTRYEVRGYTLCDSPIYRRQIKSFYCNGYWLRYISDSHRYIFECVEHSDVEEAQPSGNVAWKTLPLPKETFSRPSTTGKTMQLTRLPRQLLRCHVECPHCKQPRSRYVDEDYGIYHSDEDDYSGYISLDEYEGMTPDYSYFYYDSSD